MSTRLILNTFKTYSMGGSIVHEYENKFIITDYQS